MEAPEVFLGGSCNPTTWRADVAIPELEKLDISFFNPVSHDQVSRLINGSFYFEIYIFFSVQNSNIFQPLLVYFKYN